MPDDAGRPVLSFRSQPGSPIPGYSPKIYLAKHYNFVMIPRT